MKELGKVLKVIRVAKDLRCKEVAESIKMRQSYVSDVENGQREGMKRATLEKFAAAYSFKLSEIMELVEYYNNLEDEDEGRKYRKTLIKAIEMIDEKS